MMSHLFSFSPLTTTLAENPHEPIQPTGLVAELRARVADLSQTMVLSVLTVAKRRDRAGRRRQTRTNLAKTSFSTG